MQDTVPPTVAYRPFLKWNGKGYQDPGKGVKESTSNVPDPDELSSHNCIVGEPEADDTNNPIMWPSLDFTNVLFEICRNDLPPTTDCSADPICKSVISTSPFVVVDYFW